MTKTLLFSIVGAVTGLIVSQLDSVVPLKNIEIALFALSLFVVSFSLLFDKISTALTIKFLVLLALILSLITAYYFSQGYPQIRKLNPIFVFALIQITVICTTFFQSYRTTKPHYSYDDLFENAWNNHFFYIFTGLLTGGFCLILGLGGQLFDLLGFRASKLIWNQNITPIFVGALLGAGVGISREYDQLIFKFRSIFFALFRILAYLTAAIVILFSLALPFSIDVLFANKNTSLILLSIVAISIILLNALQDAKEDSDEDTKEQLPTWANRIFSLQIVLLPLLVSVSIYAIYLRIQQYGLMPNRIIAMWVALLIGTHAFGYLILMLFKKGRWKLGFARVNPPLAFVWVVSIILLASPLLDPIKLSANNQVQRLQNNMISPEKFDFYALKNRLGNPGKQGITEIQSWVNHPQIDLINNRIKNTKKNWRNKTVNIEVIGYAPKKVDLIKKKFSRWRCNDAIPCLIKNMQLKDHGSTQPMVFSFQKASKTKFILKTEYLEFKNNRWVTKKYYKSQPFDKVQIEEIIESIKTSEAKLITPEFSDFEIDGLQLRQ